MEDKRTYQQPVLAVYEFDDIIRTSGEEINPGAGDDGFEGGF